MPTDTTPSAQVPVAFLVSWLSLGRGHVAAFLDERHAEAAAERNHGVVLPLVAGGVEDLGDALAWRITYPADGGAELQAVMLDRTPAQTQAARLHGRVDPLIPPKA